MLSAALDIQTGGGEVLAEVPHLPRLVAATESWPPNLAVADEHLRPRGAWVLAVADVGDLPFCAGVVRPGRQPAPDGDPVGRGGAGPGSRVGPTWPSTWGRERSGSSPIS